VYRPDITIPLILLYLGKTRRERESSPAKLKIRVSVVQLRPWAPFISRHDGPAGTGRLTGADGGTYAPRQLHSPYLGAGQGWPGR
jgi:hypothetical protein